MTGVQVFWVDGQYVIKFYSYTYAGEEFFHREWDALTFLANFKARKLRSWCSSLISSASQ